MSQAVPVRQQLLGLLRDPPAGWDRVMAPVPDMYVARWSVIRPTGAATREAGTWTDLEYRAHLFVKLLPGARGVPMVKVCPAPWVTCRERATSFRVALAAFREPSKLLGSAPFGWYQCAHCGQVHEGDIARSRCPACPPVTEDGDLR